MFEFKDQKKNYIKIVNEFDNRMVSFSPNGITLGGVKLEFMGTNNVVIFQSLDCFNTCYFCMHSNCEINIQASRFKIEHFRCFANSNCKINIGANFKCLEMDVRLQENKTGLVIGDNCLFSTEIRVYATDGHVIYTLDKNPRVINKGGIIKIGNHVWCGRRVALLKGARVNDNSIIGFGSIVTKEFNKSNIVIGGYPAKIIKEGVNWDYPPAEEYERKLENCK